MTAYNLQQCDSAARWDSVHYSSSILHLSQIHKRTRTKF